MEFKEENNVETNSTENENTNGSNVTNNTNVKVETVYVNAPKPKRTGISKLGFILTLIGAIATTLFYTYEFIFAFLLFFLISPIAILFTWLTWGLGAAGNSKGWIIFGMITAFFGNPLGFFGYLFLLIGHKKSTDVQVSTVHVNTENTSQTNTEQANTEQTNAKQTSTNQSTDTQREKEARDYSEAKASVVNGLKTAKDATISFFAVIVAKIKSTEVDGKQKNLIIKIVIGIVALVIIIFGAMFVFKNFVGFTEVDLADDIILVYDTDEFTATPQIYANWNYYNENGYYDDQINYLVDTGIYTQEEAEAFIPDYDAGIANSLSMVFQSYDLSTNEELSNGDTLEVTFSYDEQFAKQNKIKVTNNVIDFEISGLKEPITTDQITSDILAQMNYTSEDAIELAKDRVSRFDEDAGDTIELVSSKVFFKADSDEYTSPELAQVFEVKYDDKEDRYTNNTGNYIVTNSAELLNQDPISVSTDTLYARFGYYETMDEAITSYTDDGYVEITF